MFCFGKSIFCKKSFWDLFFSKLFSFKVVLLMLLKVSLVMGDVIMMGTGYIEICYLTLLKLL